ncbi:MAG: transposase [Actinomycetota bacterium]
MPRPQRDLVSSHWFHIANRGVDGCAVFLDDADRHRFIERLGEVCDRHGLRVNAYALMTNHFHLLVEIRDAEATSAAMQQLQGEHAQSVNARHGRTGALFGSRFWSKPVVDDRQFLATARYVHRNPKDIVGLPHLASYRWSSLPALLGTEPTPAWLDTGRLMSMSDPARLLERLTDVLAEDLTPRWPGDLPWSVDLSMVAAAVDRGLSNTTLGRQIRLSIGHRIAGIPLTELAVHEGIDRRTARLEIERFEQSREHEPGLAVIEARCLGRLRAGIAA